MLRAISLWQPYASAIPLGHKSIETRSRLTHVRGEVAIHAAKRWSREQRDFAAVERAFGRMPERIPLGAIVAVAEIVDCKPAEELETTAIERIYGDYSPGRYGWQLANVVALSEPVGCAGAQGFFFLSDEVEDKVREQLERKASK